MKKILLLIILSVFMITGCSSKETEIVDSKTNFTSYDELFTIEAEKKWQLAEKGKLNNNANLELIDENNNKYFLVLASTKDDFNSYDNYFDTMKQNIEKEYKIKIEEENEIKVGDHDCKYVEFKSTTTDSAVNFYMQVYMIETENYYARLFAWTTYSQRDKYKDEFKEMILTFKEK